MKILSGAFIVILAGAIVLPLPIWAEGENDAVGYLVQGNNAFALDLYSQVRNAEGNLFYCPYSVSTALAMTYEGARGETAKEMAKVLHFTLNQKALPGAFGELEKNLRAAGDKRGIQLVIANSLWPQRGFALWPDYLALIRKQFGATVTPLDYGNAEQARLTINGWVEKETRGKIEDLIARGILDRDTVLVLVNAIYFRGDWMSPFDPAKTRDEPFLLADRKQVRTPMMHQQGTFRYGRFGDVQILELPYGKREMSAFLVLPDRPDGLAEVERTLSLERVIRWTTALEHKKVAVSMPRFRINWGDDLVDRLKKLGIRKAFISNEADFSGMTKEGRINITKVIHQALVEVNEKGTKAAAATAVVMERNGGQSVVFRADRPFLFFIRDRKTGSLLFLGRVADPTAGMGK